MRKEPYDYLARMPHFAMLPADELTNVATQAIHRTFEKGSLLAEQGKTRITHIHVIIKGQFSLYDRKDENHEVGGYIKAGEVFGGITLLMNGGISVRSVLVDAPTEAYLIPQEIFLDLCTRYKDFYEFFVKNFSKHIFDPALNTMIVSGQARIFLAGVAPFSFLSDDVIEKVAAQLSMVFHPKGSHLFTQGRSRVGYLYILQKGSAERYYEQDGRKTMSDILADGDSYGGISMLVNDGVSVRTLVVIEDSYFYVLPQAVFLELCRTHEVFSEFFTDTFGKRMLDKSYAAIISRTTAPPEDEVQLFNQPVRQLLHEEPVFAQPHVTIQEAARTMQRENSSYLIIPACKTHAAGIITDSDLARKVIASGYDIQRSVVEIMSTPLRTISDQAMIFEAMMAMLENDIKHLAVTSSDNQVVGMLTNREILSAQGQSPVFLLREVLRAESFDDIINQHLRIPGLVKTLISNGAKARNINRMVTTVSDAILKKIMEFVVRDMEPPPVSFAFMIMGSEGRGEQTLKTDQDNAIIFEDVSEDQLPKVHDYFLKIGQKACEMLNEAGYAFCNGDIMARNPKWCQPLSVWKDYFQAWINAAEAEDLLQASIFFDFRFGYGERRLVNQLRGFLTDCIGRWSGFLRYMTENALHFKPPLGFFRNFVVASKGEHRDALDIKSAMMPIVDFARIYTLKNGLEATNTYERLRLLADKGVLSSEEYEEIEKAYSFLMQLRFVRQVTATMEQKTRPDNFINPKRLTRIEQTMLKEIFIRIEKFQAKLNFDFIGIA
jgi:CBS domain-containing protein